MPPVSRDRSGYLFYTDDLKGASQEKEKFVKLRKSLNSAGRQM
jgi:hypothetical protein